MLFEWSMVEYVEHYLDDERLQIGVPGAGGDRHTPARTTRARRRSISTTQSGRLGGEPGMWGYVVGGMGMVSFLLCDIAREAERGRRRREFRSRGSLPGEGVELEGGERIDRRASSPTPTPRSTLRLLGDAADPAWRCEGRLGPDRRLHGQAQRRAPRVARLHRPARDPRSRTTSARSTPR